jgi:hypothetical protein
MLFAEYGFPAYYEHQRAEPPLAAIVAIGLLLITLFVCVGAWNNKDPRGGYVMGAVWAIIPPLWFWYEYFYIYLPHGDPKTFEQFKYGQQVSVAIWAGVALALFAFVSADRFKSK